MPLPARSLLQVATVGLLLLAPVLRGAEPWTQLLTRERILAEVPRDQQGPWLEYLDRSEKNFAAEKAFRDAEAKAAGLPNLKLAPYATVFGVNLDQPTAWFATEEGKRITANVISYQTPTGGWSKRLDIAKGPRAPGTDFVSETNGHYEGTFDNDSTTTQLRASARAFKATGNEAARAAALRGITYIFTAQYPNGGWPQVYPLEVGAGYHHNITYNDDVAVNILRLLRDVAAGGPDFDFVPADIRREAAAREARGIASILAAQIRVDGKLVGWGQQHDMLTLKSTGARAFEPAGICSSEGASIVRFLMEQPNPSPAIIAAVEGANAWFNKTLIMGYAWKNTPNDGRMLVAEPGAGPLWSRLYEIGTDKPIFGGVRTVLYNIAEVSRERRSGYSWFNNAYARNAEAYKAWHAKYGR